MSGIASEAARRRGKHYVKRWVPALGKRVKLHRLIAAEMLGRPLLPGEVVHHLDGDSLNNDPENLAVLPSQGHHAALESRIRRARKGQPPLFEELLNPTIYSD